MALEIAPALDKVLARIRNACAACGRSPAEVTLVAVSKTHPPESLREAYAAGVRVFGENYVQELVEKHKALADLPDIAWHFIGHLQRNKAKEIVPFISMLETLDSVRLIDAVGEKASKRAKPLQGLIQVNIASEPQKSGCAPAELETLLSRARSAGLSIEGLMTVPPATGHEEELHGHFSALRDLAKMHDLRVLSMGMSADLEIAIACGATHVRVGSAIFGERRLP